jgi:integrase
MTSRPEGTSHDVRIYSPVEVPSTVKGRPSKWKLRWRVGGVGPPHSKTFAAKTAAEGREAELVRARSLGIAFDIPTGLPVTELAAQAAAAEAARRSVTWFEHASAFAAMKAAGTSPGHRRNVAEALTIMSPAFYATAKGRPSPEELRAALYGWAFRPTVRYRTEGGERVENAPPEHLADAFAWAAANTIRMDQVDADVARRAVEFGGRRLDGKPAAAKTAGRRRSVLFSTFDYAVERRLLDANPLSALQWVRPKVAVRAVDRRSVANHTQARALLDAVGELDGGRYLRYRVFFACTYYSGLRPEEVRNLQRDNITLPDDPDDTEAWGEFLLDAADPEISAEWHDSGEREERALKHRPDGDTRPVPIPPPLVRIIRVHLAKFGWSPDGYLIRAQRGGPPPTNIYTKAFRLAREAAFTPEQQASPLARIPYDLRHACLSGWLNAGVPATQVATWAGHSLQMLLTVYAKCVDGQEEVSRARIAAALEG